MQRKALEGRPVQCIGDSWGTVPPNWRIIFSVGFYGRSDGKERHRLQDASRARAARAALCIQCHCFGVPGSQIGAKKRRRTPNIYERDQMVLIASILFRPLSSRFVKLPSKCWIALGELAQFCR